MGQIVKKIPLGEFIDALIKVWEEGAEFADLHVEIDEENHEDKVFIITRDEYMFDEDEDEDEFEEDIPENLTEDDIEGLL